ncbi:MAG: restriction endonuclease subunit S [Chlorobiaceae bacterium]|nr:restriction endonuclease subunit S [Chlorobiaceae bacterium]
MMWKIAPFDKLFIDRTGGNKKLKQSEFLEAGALPIVDQGQQFIAGYTNDEAARCNVTLPCITFGDHTRAFKLIDFPFALGADGVKVLQPTKEVDARYAYFYLNQVKLAGKEGYQRNFKYLKQVSIPLPPLPIQKQIAAILEKADAAREKRRQANKLTEQFLQSAFLEMFGDPVTNPMGWESVKLGKLGKLERGRSKHRPRNAPFLLGGPYPLIQTGEIANSSDYITKYTQTYSERGLKQSRMWPKGTLCITIAANIGKTAILTFDACFPDSIVGFTTNGLVNTEYIQRWFSFVQQQLEESAPMVAQKNINLEILRKLVVPVPPIQEQQKFATLVEKVESLPASDGSMRQAGLRAKQQESEKELENLFGSLMQKAFRGELAG